MKPYSIRLDLTAPLALAAATLAAGCEGGSGGPGGTDCRVSLLPGDLVISEVMANPIGQSEGKKWIEVYNATSESLDLEGVHLVAGSGGDTSRHVMGPIVVEPGSYAVLGGVLPEFMADYHDYAYGDDIDFPGSGGDLAIECNGEEVDSATYPGMSAGVAMGLDGAIAPDPIANGDAGNWCEAEQTFDADGSRGTPGASNDPCGAVDQETCDDGGTDRAPVPPEAGDLVITEVMGKPEDGVDAGAGEWFEVYVASDVDLNGVELGPFRHEDHNTPGPQAVEQVLASRDCLRYEAGSYILFAGSDNPDENGGLEEVDYVFDLGQYGLTNDNGGLFVGYRGEIFDHVTYQSPWNSDCTTTTATCGTALNLDPTKKTPEGSGDPANWCFAGDAFSATGRGTPGLSNGSCFSGGPCVTADGSTRDAVAPVPGDLVISEVMPNEQDGLDHTNAEWFEVFIAGESAVDLNGLQLGPFRNDEDEPREIEQTLVRRSCLRHEPGTYALFARSDDPALNSGLDAVDYLFAFGYYTLTNTDGGLYLTSDDNLEELLEVVTWTSTDSGVSLNLDPAHLTPDGSSNLDNWCDSEEVDPYFTCSLDADGVCDQEGTQGEASSYGTPRGGNPSCPE